MQYKPTIIAWILTTIFGLITRSLRSVLFHTGQPESFEAEHTVFALLQWLNVFNTIILVITLLLSFVHMARVPGESEVARKLRIIGKVYLIPVGLFGMIGIFSIFLPLSSNMLLLIIGVLAVIFAIGPLYIPTDGRELKQLRYWIWGIPAGFVISFAIQEGINFLYFTDIIPLIANNILGAIISYIPSIPFIMILLKLSAWRELHEEKEFDTDPLYAQYKETNTEEVPVRVE